MNKLPNRQQLQQNIIYVGIIITLLTVIFYSKLIFGKLGHFVHGDNLRFFYWNAKFIKETFLSGDLPLWNPYYYSGHPFQANPSSFVFYPSTLFYIFLPLAWAFTIDIFLHIFI